VINYHKYLPHCFTCFFLFLAVTYTLHAYLEKPTPGELLSPLCAEG
jgi:hypothetical protein